MNPRRAILGLLVLLTAGCGGALDGRLDPASCERLDALPDDAAVLLSLHGEGLPETLPGRRVGGFGNAVLLVTPRAGLSDLPRAERTVVWGDGAHLGRLDPHLRDLLLTRLHAGRDAEPVAAIAQFTDLDAVSDETLSALGARVGSRGGGVATLEAPPVALLCLLGRDDLVRLSKPTLQQPAASREVLR